MAEQKTVHGPGWQSEVSEQYIVQYQQSNGWWQGEYTAPTETQALNAMYEALNRDAEQGESYAYRVVRKVTTVTTEVVS